MSTVQRFRSDLGLFVHLHALITDCTFEEGSDEMRFLPAAMPTPERLTCLNRGNLERLRAETKIGLTLQGSRAVDHCMALLRCLYECPWYGAPRPGARELRFWRGRVAFVDRLVWRGHA